MSVSLSNAFVTLFDAEVKQAYQGKAMLVGAVRQRRGVEGSTVKFPKVGKGVATPRISQSDVTPLNVGFSNVTCTLSDWNAAEYSDIFSQAKVNFDERSELVQVLGNAIGRRQDQLILDALAASSTSLTVKALVAGEINTFLGFTFHILGDRSEGGLAIDGSLDRTCFAFHKDSIGYAEGIAPRTEINYIPEKTSFLVNSVFSAGAIAIDAEGIVQITARES